jgi:uncharacterized membrane protein|tara:strand:- start:11499 stop:11714 length:216 start_codon:yes stop_codon:yes gene_type:complete
MTKNASFIIYGIFGFIIVFLASSLIAPLIPFISTAAFCLIFYALFNITKDDELEKNILEMATKVAKSKERK